jgi:hypothetical protein
VKYTKIERQQADDAEAVPTSRNEMRHKMFYFPIFYVAYRDMHGHAPRAIRNYKPLNH